MKEYKSILLNENPGLWDGNKTITENAKAFKTSYSNAKRMAMINGLNYARKYIKYGIKQKTISLGSKIGRPKLEEEKFYGESDMKFTWDETLECGGLL